MALLNIIYYFNFSWSASISFKFDENIVVYIQVINKEHRGYHFIDSLRIKLCHLITTLVGLF